MESIATGDSERGRVVAIVGATGAVGEVLLRIREQRRFPVGELRPLASERSAGRTVRYAGRDLPVEVARPEAFDGVDFAFFAATGAPCVRKPFVRDDVLRVLQQVLAAPRAVPVA